jgi:hypothetical protein
MPVYQFVKPTITASDFTILAGKFGLTEGIYEGDETIVAGDKDGRVLRNYKATGTVEFNWSSHLFWGGGTPGDGLKFSLPSDEEAMKIAQNFLAEVGLLPEGDVASRVVGRTASGDSVGHLIVTFTHLVHLAGLGVWRSVRIGNNGEIVEVNVNPINPDINACVGDCTN